MHRLCAKFGLSDVGLAKVCRRRMDIPRPPRGYWRRLSTGAKTRKPSLPPPGDFTQLEVTLHGRDKIPEKIVVNRETKIPARSPLVDEALNETVANQHGTFLCSGNERLQIAIQEKVEEYDPGPTDEEKLHPKWEWKKRTACRATSELTLLLDGGHVTSYTRFYRRFKDSTCVPLDISELPVQPFTANQPSTERMPFLTKLDPNAQIKGSRDPLGLQGIWTVLGRRIVSNLTTVSTSVSDFAATMMGYAFVEQLENENSAVEIFLRWEQWAAYSRFHCHSGSFVRGVERVRARLNENSSVVISAARQHQILSNQKTYGLWGLYSMPSRECGLRIPCWH